MTHSDTVFAAPFDDFGRCLPTQATSPAHQKSRRYFYCVQPEIDFEAIHTRVSHRFQSGLNTDAAQFKDRATKLFSKLSEDASTAGLTRGVGVPFLLPKTKRDDVGTQLAQHFLPAVSGAYREKYPDYEFTDHNLVPLAGQLTVAPESRHERLLEAMATSDVVGWYFPALSEYSFKAAREQIQALPEHLWLAGGADTCAALIAAPELLMRLDGYPPLLWLGALDTDQPKIGYHFEAYGYNLTFLRRPHLDHANEYWSHGITVIDQI